MIEIPTTGGFAEYRGQRYRIVFSGDDWVALHVEPGVELPDGFAAGEAPRGRGYCESWVKVPRSALDGLLHVRVSGRLSGHVVSVQYQFPDGQVRLEFVGPPAIARELGLHGDQYMGWTGLVTPDRLTDIEVQETRRA
ncbi:hypothetical protein [Mycolicibacterium fortuitum]|uniref:hypothetical protein n=1 Tax=Mycolicibacterium fortuitum TaxID=1766 RepID=UPI0026089209|nr:hypothetical protein [Mycolicibacterium fortuitum]